MVSCCTILNNSRDIYRFLVFDAVVIPSKKGGPSQPHLIPAASEPTTDPKANDTTPSETSNSDADAFQVLRQENRQLRDRITALESGLKTVTELVRDLLPQRAGGELRFPFDHEDIAEIEHQVGNGRSTSELGTTELQDYDPKPTQPLEWSNSEADGVDQPPPEDIGPIDATMVRLLEGTSTHVAPNTTGRGSAFNVEGDPSPERPASDNESTPRRRTAAADASLATLGSATLAATIYRPVSPLGDIIQGLRRSWAIQPAANIIPTDSILRSTLNWPSDTAIGAYTYAPPSPAPSISDEDRFEEFAEPLRTEVDMGSEENAETDDLLIAKGRLS